MRLPELARRLDCRWEGRDEVDITGIASLDSAGPADLSFVTDNHRSLDAAHSQAAALIVSDAFPALPSKPLLRTAQLGLAVAQAVAVLRPAWRPQPGIHPTASLHPSAQIAADCHIGAFVVVSENCRVGPGAILHPHVVLYPHVTIGARFLAHAHVVVREGTVIGDDVILQPGVVLGGDGFGFAVDGAGKRAKIPQVGIVVIGDRVEIQANSCVDRASLDATTVGAGTKVDNLTQIGHNCRLGEDVVLCAQVGLAGSTVIDSGALLAGQAGVAGHCTIGKGAVITAQSGTHGDLEAGAVYSGSPAFEHSRWLRTTAALPRLPEMQRELRSLRAALEKLAART